MTSRKSWGIPKEEEELMTASRCIKLATSWFALLTPLLQAIAIPFLAALLLFGR